MAEFEGELQKEQQRLEDKQRREPLPDRGAGQSGSGGGSGGEAGGAEGEGESGQGKPGSSRAGAEKGSSAEKAADAKEKGEGASATGEKTEDTATGGSQAGRTDGGTPVTAPVEGGGAGGTDSTPVPKDVGDGRDDDVVARQLREAAMKEKDPAVRAKLWQEYRDYKKGTGKD
ncbi:MAG: hypothetical protein ACHQKZ_13640 [Solirubrobacterales bacterium]